jgi:hypothetical protein
MTDPVTVLHEANEAMRVALNEIATAADELARHTINPLPAELIAIRARTTITQVTKTAPVAPSVTIPLSIAKIISGDLQSHLEDWQTGMDDGTYDSKPGNQRLYDISAAAFDTLKAAIAQEEGC